MRADAAAFAAATGCAPIEAVAVGRKKRKVELEPDRISTPRMRADVAAFTAATGYMRIE